jgi:hypothetical protein
LARLDFLTLATLADFDGGGGVVVAKRLTACSDVIPFTRKSIAFGISKFFHRI